MDHFPDYMVPNHREEFFEDTVGLLEEGHALKKLLGQAKVDQLIKTGKAGVHPTLPGLKLESMFNMLHVKDTRKNVESVVCGDVDCRRPPIVPEHYCAKHLKNDTEMRPTPTTDKNLNQASSSKVIVQTPSKLQTSVDEIEVIEEIQLKKKQHTTLKSPATPMKQGNILNMLKRKKDKPTTSIATSTPISSSCTELNNVTLEEDDFVQPRKKPKTRILLDDDDNEESRSPIVQEVESEGLMQREAAHNSLGIEECFSDAEFNVTPNPLALVQVINEVEGEDASKENENPSSTLNSAGLQHLDGKESSLPSVRLNEIPPDIDGARLVTDKIDGNGNKDKQDKDLNPNQHQSKQKKTQRRDKKKSKEKKTLEWLQNFLPGAND